MRGKKIRGERGEEKEERRLMRGERYNRRRKFESVGDDQRDHSHQTRGRGTRG